MIPSSMTMSDTVLERYIRQHGAMLRCCQRIADLEIPAILQLLTEIDAALREGNAEIEQYRVQRLLEDNLAIARLAMEIHTEVNSRSNTRRATGTSPIH